MNTHVRELSRLDRSSLEAHLLTLGPEDRRLRFGVPLPDSGIRGYVAHIDFERDAVFGVVDDALRLLGAAHLARGRGHAELGVSVLGQTRGRGIGGALLARAHLHARNWGLPKLFVHCLAENAAMLRLARSQRMHVVLEAGEADAWLRLEPADAGSYFGEVFAERVAAFDYALKQGRAWLIPGR